MGGRCCGWMASRLERRPSDGYRFAPPILRAISRSRIARSLSPGAHLCDPLGQAALRAQRNLLKRFNLMLPVQSPWQKYSGSLLTQITSTSLAIPAHTQGAFRDRHGRRAGMRWTRAALLTRALICGRRSRVVLTPRRWRQAGESNFTSDGGKKARSPRRARRKPLTPLRAGMPGDPVRPW
jgi:hypothetical protein